MEPWTTSGDARDADEDSIVVLPEAFNIIRPAVSRDSRKFIDNVERSQRGKEEIEKKMIA